MFLLVCLLLILRPTTPTFLAWTMLPAGRGVPADQQLSKKRSIGGDKHCRHYSTLVSRRYAVELDSLMEMDVVIFSELDDDDESTPKRIGAIQEGRLVPLSSWTTEPLFGNSIELLVHEDDLFPGFDPGAITIHSVVPEVSFGSRQVNVILLF